MKKSIKTMLCATLAICCVSAVAGCSTGGMLTETPNTGIQQGVSDEVGKYASTAYYELERPDDVVIPFEAGGIQKVSYKYRVLDGKEYSFKNDKLTIKKSVFENETAGDKRLRVFVGGMYTEITIRVVSKVIYTTEDFNSIRTNMNGVFVLGADIDFGGAEFWPIGKAVEASEYDVDGKPVYNNSIFEGILDGMGHSVKNLVINGYDRGEGEDKDHQGPSLGDTYDNTDRNQSNGIFVSTGGSAQIINTSFVNITVNCYALSGAVVGSNGGLIKNCYVYSTINTATWNEAYPDRPYSERAGAIVGINGSGDAAGRIENCIALYSWSGKVPTRGIADWNNGIIKDCYAALKDDYVLHMGYDSELGKVPDDFDYDDYITEENVADKGLGWFTMPALPGSLSWVNEKLVFYKAGDIINADVVRKEYLLNPTNFTEENGWDREVWNFTYGAFPSLKVQSR